MDSNTLLVLIIDGGLILFFLYALYYISKLGSSTNETKPISKHEKEKTTAIKVKDYDPTYTPSPARIKETQEETRDIEINGGEIYQSTQETVEPIQEIGQDKSESTSSTRSSFDFVTEKLESIGDEISSSSGKVEEMLGGVKIIDVEGIGPAYETRLNNIGIFTVGDLLSEGATPNGRKNISDETGITGKLVLEWVNICDLYRISGVGEEYSDLLEEAGVDTVPELARRNPENLHTKMSEVNDEKNLVRRLPSISDVELWIEEAKKLPRKIEY